MDNYIIGISGSDLDTVKAYRVRGTEKKVKHHLLELVKSDRRNDPDSWDFGTEKLSDITEIDGVLYAFGSYESYHNDYTATPEEAPIVL